MVAHTITELGYIDVLVNNAGIYQEHPLERTSYQDWQTAWQQTLSINLLGAVNVAYCVARHMMERQGGRIINVTRARCVSGRTHGCRLWS